MPHGPQAIDKGGGVRCQKPGGVPALLQAATLALWLAHLRRNQSVTTPVTFPREEYTINQTK